MIAPPNKTTKRSLYSFVYVDKKKSDMKSFTRKEAEDEIQRSWCSWWMVNVMCWIGVYFYLMSSIFPALFQIESFVGGIEHFVAVSTGGFVIVSIAFLNIRPVTGATAYRWQSCCKIINNRYSQVVESPWRTGSWTYNENIKQILVREQTIKKLIFDQLEATVWKNLNPIQR